MYITSYFCLYPFKYHLLLLRSWVKICFYSILTNSSGYLISYFYLSIRFGDFTHLHSKKVEADALVKDGRLTFRPSKGRLNELQTKKCLHPHSKTRWWQQNASLQQVLCRFKGYIHLREQNTHKHIHGLVKVYTLIKTIQITVCG